MLANVNLDNDLKLLDVHGKVMVIGCRGSIEINPRLTMGTESSIMGVMLFRYLNLLLESVCGQSVATDTLR